MFDQIKQEIERGIAVISLKGQFVGGDETDALRQALADLANQEHGKAVINLEQVTYLNSTALGVLISAHSNFIKRGGKIVLCSIGKNIENVFIITKLTLVFDICETREEAITKLL